MCYKFNFTIKKLTNSSNRQTPKRPQSPRFITPIGWKTSEKPKKNPRPHLRPREMNIRGGNSPAAYKWTAAEEVQRSDPWLGTPGRGWGPSRREIRHVQAGKFRPGVSIIWNESDDSTGIINASETSRTRVARKWWGRLIEFFLVPSPLRFIFFILSVVLVDVSFRCALTTECEVLWKWSEY